MADTAPTARQRRLASELHKLRESAGLTQAQAAQMLGWNRTKIVRIEGAQQVPTVDEVEHVLESYGPTDEAIRLALVQLARDARRRGWWTAYGDVLAGSHIELEDAASRIRVWQAQVVPGLLQIPAYAREVIAAEVSDSDEVERRVDARMKRRTLLDRADAPELDVVLAEEVLRRLVGGRPVMRQQLAELLRAAERPNVSVRVVPLSAGAYPTIGQGGLTIFEVPGDLDLSVAYFETMRNAVYVEDIAQVRECRAVFERLAGVALSKHETAQLIARICEEMTHDG